MSSLIPLLKAGHGCLQIAPSRLLASELFLSLRTFGAARDRARRRPGYRLSSENASVTASVRLAASAGAVFVLASSRCRPSLRSVPFLRFFVQDLPARAWLALRRTSSFQRVRSRRRPVAGTHAKRFVSCPALTVRTWIQLSACRISAGRRRPAASLSTEHRREAFVLRVLRLVAVPTFTGTRRTP